ncbi:MAG: glutaminase A [Alphaproteobacteria bacterium]|nr:glutaminase A [Alphaproteobacteria bacterium]
MRKTCFVLTAVVLVVIAGSMASGSMTPAMGQAVELRPQLADARSASRAARLPSVEALQKLVNEAHAKFKDVKEGKNADYIPALAEVDSNLFGIAIVTIKGDVVAAGDVDYSFAIESVAKPFTMALVMQEQGTEAIREKIGVEPTGMPFNSVMAVELLKARSVNPLVNAGAMTSVSMVRAKDGVERWNRILDNLNRFAGEDLKLLDVIYKSEAATNQHNRGIAELLMSYERFYSDPQDAVDIYTKQSSVGVTAKQLAMMGAVFANGGVQPKTSERLLDAAHVPEALALMLIAGFYDESGAWAFDAGLPSKTGVGGGIVSVAPGKLAIAAFSPPLNEAGNSVRAQLAIKHIASALKLSVFGAGE